MEITITRRDSSTYKVQVDSGTLTQQLMSADTATLKVTSSTPIELRIDDVAIIQGGRYRINRLPQANKVADNRYTYTIELEGEMYNLLRAQFLLFDDTGVATEGEFSYMGTLEDVVLLLVKNLNRVYESGTYVMGAVPETEAKNHTFNSENCLAVIQRVCSEYEQEFDLIHAAGTTTINIGEVGSLKSFSLKYGAGNGLYELERTAINDKNVFTRLFAYGGDRNLKGDYRGFSRRLKLPLNDESYIEDAGAIAAMGIIEHTKLFEDIYPHRTGIVGTVGDTATFTDTGMDFDLNAKEGENTLYLIPGNAAKVHFNTGNLAGYEFEVLSYNHTTKTFVLKKYKDERGTEFPSAGAFAIQPGDEYVLLDITMPQSYIDAAEAELQTKATEYLNQGKVVKAKYSCKIDPIYAKTEGLSLQAGDYIPIEDTGLNIDRSLRVISVTRDVVEPYRLTVDLGDEVEVSYITQLFQDRIETNKIVKLNRLKDPAVYRNSWKNTKELQSMIFDQEDYFDTENIKPLSIETSMLSVGSKAGQFVLNGVVFQPSFNAVPNRIVSTGGTLSHYAIEENIRTWNISAYDVTIPDDNPRYIYAKCAIASGMGEIRYNTAQLKVDAEAGYYNFLIGVLHSVTDNYRKTSLTYGSTTINGKEIKTGRIKSQDGNTYFDLDTGKIQGKISFSSGSSGYNNLDDKPDLSVYTLQDDVDALTANLQEQIDGQIMTFFYDYVPTLANAPANGWTTNTERDKHLGDLFYNSATGLGYRYSKVGTTYSWELLKDTDVATALANAAAAQDTADGKRRVFVSTPTTPYEVGDLWTQGASGELMRCKITRLTGSYTATDWEKAVKYTDDTAVDNLDIGGLNLFIESTAETGKYVIQSTGELGASGAHIASNYINVLPNNRYTFSTLDALMRYPCYAFYDSSKTYISGGKQNEVSSVLLVSPPNAKYLRVSTDILSGGKQLKVERGSSATDWTPAPEDVQAEIDVASTAAANAQASADTAAGSVSSLNDYVDGAFQDGIIEASEATAIEKYINSVNESWIDFESTYNVIYANSYLEGTPKTNLLNAKITLAGAKTDLITSINNAIADGITTVAEKADVDSKFAAFNTAVASFKTALENANKAIQDKLDALSAGYASSAAQAAAAAQEAANNAAAAANTANSNISDIADDNKFTPDEKSAVRREWEIIDAERHPNNLQADAFGITTEKNAYNIKFNALGTYLNNGTTWGGAGGLGSGVPSWISDDSMAVTTNINGTAFRLRFREYYDARTALLNAIAAKAKELADAAQDGVNDLDYLKEAMANDTSIDGGLISTSLIKLGATSGGIGVPGKPGGSWVERAGINGTGTGDNTPRLYAGGTLQNAIQRIAGNITSGAKFVVTQGGKIYGMEAELFGSFSTAPPGGKRIHLSQEAGTVNMHDDDGRVKASISASPIPPIAQLLSPSYVSIDATKNYAILESNGASLIQDDSVYSPSLILPADAATYTIITPRVTCFARAKRKEYSDRVTVIARAYLEGVHGSTYLGGAEAMAFAFIEDDQQSRIIEPKEFLEMPFGTYRIRLRLTIQAEKTYEIINGSVSVQGDPLFHGEAKIDVSKIFTNGIFLNHNKYNYMYISPLGVQEKLENAPDRPGLLLSGCGAGNGGSTAMYGAKRHATLTVSKVSTGKYYVYHSIGHTKYSVQVTPMDPGRSAMWDEATTSRFTVYTYFGSALAGANFSFAVFGNN